VFSSHTTIIIGAGSSVDYGLPLGKALWDQIVVDCDKLPKELSQHFEKNFFGQPERYFRHASQSNPKAYAFFSLMRNGRSDIQPQPAKDLADHIKRANVHDNVDDFVRDNPSLKEPMQTLIAGNLFENLYQHDEDKSGWALKPRIFERIFRVPPPGKNVENWIRHFIGLCRNQLQLVPQGKGVHPVTVISFNYDRLMESVLRYFWDQSEVKHPKIDDCFKFLYPYGAFSELKSHVPEAGPWLVQQSKEIAITGSAPSSQKTVAREALEKACEIYMLGFSCLESNMQWLGLTPKLGKKVFAQNFQDGDERLARVLAKINADSDKGSMIQLVRNGFFEQRGQHP
jgi:hypothetical protein